MTSHFHEQRPLASCALCRAAASGQLRSSSSRHRLLDCSWLLGWNPWMLRVTGVACLRCQKRGVHTCRWVGGSAAGRPASRPTDRPTIRDQGTRGRRICFGRSVGSS